MEEGISSIAVPVSLNKGKILLKTLEQLAEHPN
jgi:hypothetical protein